mgnify:FL=1
MLEKESLCMFSQYNKKGWIKIPGLLSEEETNAALEILGVEEDALPKNVGTEKNYQRMLVMYHSNVFRGILRTVVENSIVNKELQKFKRPIVEHMKPLIKAAGGVETPWHQDQSFWTDFDPEQTMFTVWVSLTKASDDSGSLRILDVKNFTETFPHIHVNNNKEHALKGDVLSQLLNQGEQIKCDVKPGDALIFRSGVIHGAYPNASNQARIGFKYVFQDAGKRPVPIAKSGYHLTGIRGMLNKNFKIPLFGKL